MPVQTNTAGLKRFRAQLDAAIDRGAARGGQMIVDLAKEIVPVASGDLRDSIRLQPQAGSGKGVYTVAVGNKDVDYAAYVEYGTVDSPAQPFLRPATDAIDVPAEIAAELKKIR